MLGAQRPDQRILNDVVRRLGIAGQRPRIAPQRRNCRLDPLAEFAQESHLLPNVNTCGDRSRDAPAFNNTMGRRLFRALDGPMLAGSTLAGSMTLCHRRPGWEIAIRGQENAGTLGPHARQTRPGHGGRQPSLAGLGHRQGVPGARRRTCLYLSGRRAQEARRAAGPGGRRHRGRRLRRDRAGDHRCRVRRRAIGVGQRSTFWFTPSRFPTRTSSTAAMSTPPRTISPRQCW